MSTETYSELINIIAQDVYRHKHASSWPSSVLQFVQPLQSTMRLPRWSESSPVPHTDERVLHLLNQLRASEDASDVDLWDATDDNDDRNVQDRLHVVFNAALVDCARVRKVVELEEEIQSPCPKESFLAILVQDAVMLAHNGLYILEDVPVILSRSFSGVTISLPGLIERAFHVPLIVTICEAMPVEKKNQSDSSPSKPLKYRHYPTVEEFLRTPTTSEDSEEEPDEPDNFPWLQAYFVAHPSLDTPSFVCHIPVLCMAEEEQLPLVMSSLLYQRSVWHVTDPLIGITFSKYETMVRLFVGWLENVPGSVLPRVHIGEIQTQVKLDLSSPSVALVVSRLLCGLGSHISSVRDTVRRSASLVMRETESQSSLAWRIDTDVQEDKSVPILEINTTRDWINRWVESQHSEEMPQRKRADDASNRSLTLGQPHLLSASVPLDVSKEGSRTPKILVARSFLTCSKFSATIEKNDERIFSWMFGRRVAPQSLPYRQDFCKEYIKMTEFIWPKEWENEEDLPPVDAVVKPLVKELVESVGKLKNTKRVSKDDFPIDLRIVERSFSSIFLACHRSREKTENPEFINETSWRHDHDRLLLDFFVRLVQPDAAHTPIEDPLIRPTFETILRMPRSDALRKESRDLFEQSSENLLIDRPGKIQSWVKKRGGNTLKAEDDEDHHFYVSGHYTAWQKKIDGQTELQTVKELVHHPLTGTCGAFGRLLVGLPEKSPNASYPVPLVIRSTAKDKNLTTLKPDTDRKDEVEQVAESSSEYPSVEEEVPEPRGPKGKHYTTIESSFRPHMSSLDRDNMVTELTSKIQNLRLCGGSTHLELPLLTVEYKKESVGQATATNQVRMHLTTSVKFLEALGIRKFAVYGVQADGSRLAIPAAIVQDDTFVYLFERLVQEIDISTPVGAFHYVTILCRLAQNHARELEKRFDAIKDQLGNLESWTMEKQHDELKARAEESEVRR